MVASGSIQPCPPILPSIQNECGGVGDRGGLAMGLAPFGWGDTGVGVKPSNGSCMERRFLQSPCRSAASVLPTHSSVGFLGRDGDAPKLCDPRVLSLSQSWGCGALWCACAAGSAPIPVLVPIPPHVALPWGSGSLCHGAVTGMCRRFDAPLDDVCQPWKCGAEAASRPQQGRWGQGDGVRRTMM